ncbi:MAG: hypothetical protein L7U87_06800 [Chlamydiales bacterium]|nr:hypothetical protein [Chlamydiales bacterium]
MEAKSKNNQQLSKDENFIQDSCGLITEFYQSNTPPSSLNSLSESLQSFLSRKKLDNKKHHKDFLELISLSLAKESEAIAINELENSSSKQAKVGIALRKLILDKFFDLFSLYTPFLPYHNFMHSVKVGSDAAFLAKGISWKINSVAVSLSDIELVKGMYHDIRFYYVEKKRQAGYNLKTESEGLSFNQFMQDLQLLEQWIQKHAGFTFRFSSDFIHQVQASIFSTVPKLIFVPFSVHNQGHLDFLNTDEDFQALSDSFWESDRNAFLDKHYQKLIHHYKSMPDLIGKLFKKVPEALSALADISSLISAPDKWEAQEIDSLFIEEHQKAFHFIWEMHQKYDSFTLLPPAKQKAYLDHMQCYQNWLKLQLNFSRSRIASAYLRFYLPLRAAIKIVKDDPSLLVEEKLTILERVETNFIKLFCQEAPAASFPAIKDEAYQKAVVKFLQYREKERDAQSQTHDSSALLANRLRSESEYVKAEYSLWRAASNLIKVFKQRTLANYIFLEKDFEYFTASCSQLRRFP